MKSEDRDYLSECMGIEPIRINSKLVCAALRDRYYWTNIPQGTRPSPNTQVIDDILLESAKDYKVKDFEKYKDTMKFSRDKTTVKWDSSGKSYYSQQNRALRGCKSPTITRCGRDKCNVWLGGTKYRHIHPIEAERLQTLPDNYTKVLDSDIKRIQGIGNGWTVNVIVELLRGLKNL